VNAPKHPAPVIVHARIPSALAEELRELARAEDRSFSGEVRRALSAHVKAYVPATRNAARR
jgi:hypothetical protein